MNTLDSLFTWFLAATIRASLLALAVLAIQAALRTRMSARWRYVLWLPVALVLVAPSLPESSWSVDRYVVVRATPAPTAASNELQVSLATSPQAMAAPTIAAAAHFEWRRVLAAVWLAGMAGLISAGGISYARTMRRMRSGAVSVGASIRAALTEAAEACGLRRAPSLLVSREVSSPAVTGFFRPVLLLPEHMQAEFSKEELHLVLCHECTHLRRWDVAGNWLLCLLQAVHWCNPVLWFAFARLRVDREAACDEQVMALRGEERRADYGHLLLKLAGAPSQGGFAVGWVGIFGPGAAMRSRILSITRYRRRHAGWGLLSVALVAALIVIGATRAPMAKASEDKAPQIIIQSQIISMQTNPDVPIDISGDRLGVKGEDAVAIQNLEALKALLDQFAPGKGGRVLSAPTVMTRDGQRAIIEAGEEAPAVPGEARRFAGYRLEMTPNVEKEAIRLELAVTINRAVDTETGRVLPTPIQDWSRVKIEGHKFTQTETLAKGQSFTIYHPGYAGNDPAKRRPAIFLAVTPKIVAAADLPNGGVPAKPAGDILGEARVAPADKPEAPKPASPEVARVTAIVIPKLVLREASLVEALQELSALAKKADPAGKGVTIVAPAQNDARITLQLSDVPVIEALKYITNLSNMRYRIEADKIVITPLEGPAVPIKGR